MADAGDLKSPVRIGRMGSNPISAIKLKPRVKRGAKYLACGSTADLSKSNYQILEINNNE